MPAYTFVLCKLVTFLVYLLHKYLKRSNNAFPIISFQASLLLKHTVLFLVRVLSSPFKNVVHSVRTRKEREPDGGNRVKEKKMRDNIKAISSKTLSLNIGRLLKRGKHDIKRIPDLVEFDGLC